MNIKTMKERLASAARDFRHQVLDYLIIELGKHSKLRLTNIKEERNVSDCCSCVSFQEKDDKGHLWNFECFVHPSSETTNYDYDIRVSWGPVHEGKEKTFQIVESACPQKQIERAGHFIANTVSVGLPWVDPKEEKEFEEFKNKIMSGPAWDNLVQAIATNIKKKRHIGQGYLCVHCSATGPGPHKDGCSYSEKYPNL